MADADRYRAWKKWEERDFARYDVVEARLFALELSNSGMNLSAQASVLELGFGNGHFAGWVRDRGWKYMGTEMDPELVSRARSQGFDVHSSDTPLSSMVGGFDAIVAFDVLEHLSMAEIVQVLEAGRTLLKADGRLIARVPSGDSPFSGHIQYGDITHRTVLGSGIVQHLAMKAGYDVCQIRSPAFPIRGIGFKRFLRRSLVLAGRQVLTTLIRLFFLDNMPSVVDANMVFVLTPTDSKDA